MGARALRSAARILRKRALSHLSTRRKLYPDVPPDMFHTMPWVKLTPDGRYPTAADQPVIFAGQQWQRWSRHNNEWRAGVDGIWTMLKRIDNALAVAA